MKKYTAIILSAMIAAAVSVPAAAANEKRLTETDASAEIGVIAEFTASDPADTVISADIKWDEMEFNYRDGDKVWDTENYKDVTKPGKWENAEKDITVINHSNTGIYVTVGFKSDIPELTGTFSRSRLWVDSAVETDINNPPSETVRFGISGGSITEDREIGTVTVSVVKADVTAASSAEELNRLLADGGFFKAANDMSLNGVLYVTDKTKPVIIDLNGKTLTADSGNKALEISSDFTLKNGTLINKHEGQLVLDTAFPGEDSAAEIYVSDCKLESAYSAVSIQQNIKLTLRNCELVSGADTPAVIMDNRGGAVLTMSGNVRLNGAAIQNNGNNTVKCLAGIYDFDPTNYVDADKYTVAEDAANGIWAVSEG